MARRKEYMCRSGIVIPNLFRKLNERTNENYSYRKGRQSLGLFLCAFLALFIFACTNNTIVDSNISVQDNSWTYAKTAKSTIDITDTTKAYAVYFKLRHTADYRYANLYVIFRLKGKGLNKKMRYQFKLAQADGRWLGKGSGDLYTYQFPLLKDFQFPLKGKYELEIEQNMRDNPLTGVSDIGILVAANK